jgi:hypothetical protein
MKTITLKEAYQILQDASATIINDDVVLYPSLEAISGDKYNEFLYFGWDDGGREYNLRFLERDNQEVEVEGSSLFFYAVGDTYRTEVTILTKKELE